MSFDVLTLDEAAERARVSRRQLNYRLAAGDGPAITVIGGARRIRSDVLEDWLRRCTTGVEVAQRGSASPDLAAVA